MGKNNKQSSRQKWMKLIQSYDEEFKYSDYTPDEIEEILSAYESSNQDFKNKYFSFYNDIKSSSLKKQDW